MPSLSRWSIGAALIYLALGFTLGGLLLANKGLAFWPVLWLTLPSHMDFLLIGWMVQLAFGVAFWILPRFGKGRPRGKESVAWAAIIGLNLGIWLVVGGSMLSKPGFILAGRVVEMAASLVFILAGWKRVKPFGI